MTSSYLNWHCFYVGALSRSKWLTRPGWWPDEVPFVAPSLQNEGNFHGYYIVISDALEYDLISGPDTERDDSAIFCGLLYF